MAERVTRAQMVVTLEDVSARAAPRLRHAMREVAAALDGHTPVEARRLGPLGAVVERILRDPGEEG